MYEAHGGGNRSAFPLASYAASASPHEVTIVAETLAQGSTAQRPSDPCLQILNSLNIRKSYV